jgi:hypothetical protein
MKLTETPYLAALPIAGTLAAYLFEFGFASYHGIPGAMIQLNVSQFVGAAVLGLFCLWIIHLYFSLGIAFLVRRKLLIFKFIGLGMLYAFLPFLFLLGMGNEKRLWILFIFSFLVPSLSGLGEALFAKNKNQPFSQRWWEHSVSAPEKQKDGFHTYIDVPQLWFSILFFSVVLSVAAGNRYASLATPTMVAKSDPSKVLIVIYGERWFFRPLQEVDQPRSTSKGELHILSGDSTNEVILIPAARPNAASEK